MTAAHAVEATEEAGGFGFGGDDNVGDSKEAQAEAAPSNTNIKGFRYEAGELADGGDIAEHVTQEAAVETCNTNGEAMGFCFECVEPTGTLFAVPL